MDLNHIVLPPQLIVSLYSNKLILSNISPNSILNELTFLGNNKKNIVIIISNATTPYLEDNEFTLLSNVLGACKLTLADIALINVYNKDSEAIQNTINLLKAKIVMMFGVEPLDIGLPMNFPHFQIQSFNNLKYLGNTTLQSLENDKELKKKLWVCLKELFGI